MGYVLFVVRARAAFENADKLRAVPILNGTKPVLPSKETIENGSYAPFSRPLFIYVSKNSMQRPEVKEFIKFYLENCGELAEEVGYVRLPKVIAQRAAANVMKGRIGTQFLTEDGEKKTGPVTNVYQ